MTLDGFFGRAYHPRRYNCAHFAIDVWEYLNKRTVADSMRGFLVPGPFGEGLRHPPGVKFLTYPMDPCFVLMRSKVLPPHVGVYYRYKIIHLAGNHKVQNQPPEIAALGYTRVRYFTC